MRLANKVAIITGAASGIGRASAMRFAEEEASVCVADMDVAGGEETVHEIVRQGGSAIFCRTDVSRESDTRDMVDATIGEFGALHLLVNNAAAFVFRTIENVTEADWDRVLGVNVKGYAFSTKYAVPHLRRAGGGSIVNVGSVSCFIGQSALLPYNTSKGAVIQLTRCLACDLAGDNIRVNCVCPGAVETPQTIKHAREQGKTKEQLIQELSANQFIKRMAQPQEIANAILFLASDDASFITGAPLMVDGGWTAQ